MNRGRIRTLCILLGVVLLSGTAAADVTLPAIFGDHMVLQQNKNVAVWGWAEPGEKITVKGSWQWLGGKKTKADENGQWKVKIKTPKAKANGEAVTLSVKGNNEIVLQDVLIGEVWICSGQSNMEFKLDWLKNDENEKAIANANDSAMRLFTVKKDRSLAPKEDCTGDWQLCSPETARDFSATGYYFGKKLYDELGVPVGLISTNWGGTPSEAWTSRQALKPFDRFQSILDITADPETAIEKAKEAAKQKVEDWKKQLAQIDPGTKEQWQMPAYDDADWKTQEQPISWADQDDLKGVDGIVWYRRTTNLPPSWANTDMELHLGEIDDIDTVWINGVEVGMTTLWVNKRIYRVPSSALKVGRNVIAVRVVDTGGDGGFRGKPEDMRIGPVGAKAESFATVGKTWKYKLSYQGKVDSVPSLDGSFDQNTPTVLYNAMIEPLLPFRIAGAIWYQGESNCYDPILYRTLFPAMIEDWRNQWGQGDFPFYFVQIAPYIYDDNTASQALREAQMMSLATPKTGMAVTMDIGERTDIHPKNKWDVGDRLARWALAKTYRKKGIAYSGPLYKDMKVQHGAIRLSFDYVGEGLVARGGPLTDFMIAGEDQKFVPAKAVIEGDEVVVSSQDVKNPVSVRYAWSNWASPNLFNEAGLPASSFRTDDWPL